MKKILFTLAFLLFMTLVNGQEWFQEVAVWKYHYYNTESRVGHLELSVVGEEVKAGILCKKIHLVLHLSDMTQFPSPEWTEDLGFRYVYTENNGNKVNLFRDGLFYTMYDFDAEINDTWTTISANYSVDCFNGNTGQIIVVDKGTENINGVNLDYIDLQTLSGSDALLYGRVYKYIGSRDMCFFPEYNYGTEQCGYMPEDAQMSQSLFCFSDNYVIYGTGSCEATVSVNELLLKENIKVYQKNDYLIIDADDSSLQNIKTINIYNVHGSLLMSTKENNQIPISHINHGIYFIELLSNKSSVVQKIHIR